MAFPIESYAAKIQRKLLKKQRVIEAASGRQKADLVLKNATYVNVFSNELLTCDIAVANGLIVGLGSYEGEVEYDMTGKIVCPGFVDAHIHLESSLVTPKEFVRATLPHGTTTVITDPHEITNVMGTDGIDYMFQATEGLNFCKRILFSGMFFLLLPLPFRFPFSFCFLVPTAPFCFCCRRIFLLCFRFGNRLRRRLLARHFRSGGSFFLLVLLDQLCLQGLHFCRFGIVSVQFCLLVFQIKL